MSKRKLDKLHTDMRVLCVSLVLTEPSVNAKQMRLIGRVMKQLSRLSKPNSGRKGK